MNKNYFYYHQYQYHSRAELDRVWECKFLLYICRCARARHINNDGKCLFFLFRIVVVVFVVVACRLYNINKLYNFSFNLFLFSLSYVWIGFLHYNNNKKFYRCFSCDCYDFFLLLFIWGVEWAGSQGEFFLKKRL